MAYNLSGEVIVLEEICPWCGLPDMMMTSNNGSQRRHSDDCIEKIILEEIRGIREGWIKDWKSI